MRLNLQTDYALRMLIHLCLVPDRPVPIGEVAETFGISKNHLVKVGNRLVHLGFAEALRGRSGGLRLARAPERIVVGDVVRRIEPDFAVVECFAHPGKCAIDGACRLRGVLADAREAFLAVLDGITLAELVVTPERMVARLGLPNR